MLKEAGTSGLGKRVSFSKRGNHPAQITFDKQFILESAVGTHRKEREELEERRSGLAFGCATFTRQMKGPEARQANFSPALFAISAVQLRSFGLSPPRLRRAA